jgi:hypothetical protein
MSTTTRSSDPTKAPANRLLTRSETVALLRARGCPHAAADLATGHAGPPFVAVNGEQLHEWDAAFAWGRDREYLRPWDCFSRAENPAVFDVMRGLCAPQAAAVASSNVLTKPATRAQPEAAEDLREKDRAARRRRKHIAQQAAAPAAPRRRRTAGAAA